MYFCANRFKNMKANCLSETEIDIDFLTKLLQSVVKQDEENRLAEVFRIISFHPKEVYGPHHHYRIEINYVKKGNCILHLDNESVAFREDEMMIIPSNVNHMFEAGVQGVTIMQLEFIPELFLSLPLNEESKTCSFLGINSEESGIIKIVNDVRIMHAIQNIITELNTKEPYYQQLVFINYAELYVMIHRFLKDSYIPMCNNKVLQHAIAYIREVYKEEVTISHISEECGVSERYLRKLFAQFLKFSPLDYINSIRINKAIDLLRNSDMSIKEVSYQCGFKSPQYFSRVFKQRTGTSPRDFN